jgi:hypothetical protein
MIALQHALELFAGQFVVVNNQQAGALQLLPF